MSSSSSLPESTITRIKSTLFRILKLPAEAVHLVEVDVRKFGSEVKIVLKKDLKVATRGEDFKRFEDTFRNNDRFEADAINENNREYVFSVPPIVKPQLEELSKINSHEVILNKQDVVERLAAEIDDKYYKDAAIL